jgi:DNA-directed RNA polymerase subunit alpha
MTSKKNQILFAHQIAELLVRQVFALERIASALEEQQDEAIMKGGGISEIDTIFKSVNILDLSVRAANVLDAAGIKLIGDLIQLSEDRVGSFKNSGAKVITSINVALNEYGLRLGTPIPFKWKERSEKYR